MIRFLGGVLILFACGLLCFKLHLQLVDGFHECCLFQGILLEIRRNNKLACVVMADLMQESLKSMPHNSAVAEATRMCVQRLREQKMPMEWIWEQYVGSIQRHLHLPVTILIQIKRLGRVISHKDSETIERYLEGVYSLLTEEIQIRSKNLKKKDLVNSTLCAMAGIMTILLLI